jgi:hypothetical protein
MQEGGSNWKQSQNKYWQIAIDVIKEKLDENKE